MPTNYLINSSNALTITPTHVQGLPKEVAAAFLKQNELDEQVCRLASSNPEPNPDPNP